MIIRPTTDFLTWYQRLPKDHRRVVAALLNYLNALVEPPEEGTATLQRLVQAKRHQLWRIKHPHHNDYAYRLIIWFSDHEPGVAYILFGGDKHDLDDVFYNRATNESQNRVDQLIRTFKE